jgi:hypothetical protein
MGKGGPTPASTPTSFQIILRIKENVLIDLKFS